MISTAIIYSMASANQLHNVAAIDFGTTYCSLSYAIDGRGTVEMLVIDENKTRVPTALLLKRNEDGSISRIDIGFVAQQKHTQLSKKKYKEHIFFECFKMELRDEEVDYYYPVYTSHLNHASTVCKNAYAVSVTLV